MYISVTFLQLWSTTYHTVNTHETFVKAPTYSQRTWSPYRFSTSLLDKTIQQKAVTVTYRIENHEDALFKKQSGWLRNKLYKRIYELT